MTELTKGSLMSHNYTFYFCDTETTGLDPYLHSPIEISLIRLGSSNEEQKTWNLKPINLDSIELSALRVNGHKIEDLKGQTKFGIDTYKDPTKTIVDIENWISQDNSPSEYRCLIGQNISFDIQMLQQLWNKCDSKDSYPFGRRYIDTMVIELFLDYCKGNFAEGYSLSNLTKKYGIKNDKAHSASADTKATKELFFKQTELFKKILLTNA